jgi:hypothetical protein
MRILGAIQFILLLSVAKPMSFPFRNTRCAFSIVSLVLLALGCTASEQVASVAPAPVAPQVRRVASIRLVPSSLAMTSIGDTARVSATVLDQFGVVFDAPPPLQWVNFAPVLLSSSLLITATREGSGAIVVSAGGVSALVDINVKQLPAKIALTPTTLRFTALTETVLMDWQVQDARGNWILLAQSPQWSTSNAAVASVSGVGIVTAVGTGSAVVTAQSGALRSSVAVEVSQVATRISSLQSSGLMKVGDKFQCLAEVRDSRNNLIPNAVITWISLTPNVVSINPSGIATALALGEGQVVARINGVSTSPIFLFVRP